MLYAEEWRESMTFATRDGREVIDWWVVEHPEDTFFPVRAKIRCADGAIEEHQYTRNGRRYINVVSGLDLMMEMEERRPDCMPEPLRAIRYIETGRAQWVDGANKVCRDSSSGGCKVYDTSCIRAHITD